MFISTSVVLKRVSREKNTDCRKFFEDSFHCYSGIRCTRYVGKLCLQLNGGRVEHICFDLFMVGQAT